MIRLGKAYIGECFATVFLIANMRLFPGMRPNMNRQGAALDEALVAALDGAVIRSFIGMYPLMPGKV